MAEFCLKCWNKINRTNDDERDLVMSKDLDFCEGCGEWKHVVIRKRKSVWDIIFSILYPYHH